MSIKITSKYPKEIFLKNIENLYKKNKWYSLPKGISGSINNNKVNLGIQAGIIFWLGRGRLKGTLQSNESGSILEGELNSPTTATIIPLIIFAPLLYLAKNEILIISITGVIFCVFGYLLVKADHSQLIEALNEAANNNG